MAAAANRGRTGNSPPVGQRFQKGKSGNPSGRPKVIAEVQDLARAHTADAIRTLVSIANGKKQPAAARVSAASAILDRGYGKPTQAITGAGGAPLLPGAIKITIVEAKPEKT